MSSVEDSAAQEFSKELNIHYVLSKILLQRNIKDKESARGYFKPCLSGTHDPFLMKDMDVAVGRLVHTIESKEKILVFGDYDVDGTSGVSMFHLFLNQLSVPNNIYIPDRFTDGYGLSKTGINFAKENGIGLIVAIDCGITAFDKVEYAKSQNIEMIICDHHQPPEKIPNALAVLDPLRKDCSYPFKYLCGTGVAYKLICAICSKLNLDIHNELLDFVAIATAADMVPILDENRIFLYHGFKQISSNPRPSIKTLIRISGFKSETINTTNVVFALGPRINAVGRLGDAIRAVKFLTSETISDADELVKILESENTNRKKIDSEIFIQAQERFNSFAGELNYDDIYSIVLHNEDWHPGVLGIIASRMVDKYYRPSIILTTFNGNAKGSARSIHKLNIYEAILRASKECDAVIQFGGHFYAAGLELKLDKVEEFRKVFNNIVKDMIESSEEKKEMLVPQISIDSNVELNEVDFEFMRMLKHFEPYGPGNMNPVFCSNNLQVVGYPKIYNSTTSVFKVRTSSENENQANIESSKVFDCIYYQSDINESNRINCGDKLNAIFNIEENHWNGNTKIQLRIKDFRSVNS